MGEYVGKLLTCSRCDREAFLKRIGDLHLDGGYTTVDQYEDKPKGWIYVSELGGHICNNCAHEFKHLVYHYMKEFNKKPCQSWLPDYCADPVEVEETTNE